MGVKWSKIPVADVCDIFLGGTPKRSEPNYWGGSIKWASAKDVSNCTTRYLTSTEDTITQKGLEESAAKVLEKYTVVITARGTVGAVCMLGEPMSFNQTCYGLVGKKNITQDYLYYALKNALSQIRSISYGTIFDTITMKSFQNLKISLPDITQQHAIAHLLGTLDDKIELNRKMNETLEAMARAIFKFWFVDFDPVHAKAQGRDTGLPKEIVDLFPDSFEDSDLGKIPKGWEVKSLNEIAAYLNGLACQKYPPEKGKESLPVIKIRELRQGITENTDRVTINVPDDYIVNDGDVLFSWSGSLLLDIWTQGKSVLNQHLFKITSENYPKWFYYYWTKYHLNDFKRIASYKATTMGHIKRHHLEDAKVLIANKSLMKIADGLIHPIFKLKVKNELEVKQLANIRDILLPKLISGELRIKNPEKFVEEADL